MSTPRKFKIGDYVFAKMRGHPPWPAKIKTIKEKPMGKSFIELYDVYFYGTSERGTCTKNLIFPYSKEFKEKNMIQKTKRYAHLYNNALKLMEEEIFNGVKVEPENESAEVKKDVDVAQMEVDKIVEVKNESKTCSNIDKEEKVEKKKIEKKEIKKKEIEKKENEKKEPVLPKREIVINIKRIDDVYSDLKSNQTIDLKTKKAVVQKSNPVVSPKRPKDIYSMIDDALKRLPTPKKNKRVIGRRLYTTNKDAPCIIQNVCTVDEKFFQTSDDANFVEEKAMELFDPKGYRKTTDKSDYWAFGEPPTSTSTNKSVKVNAILLKSTNINDPKQYLMMPREHNVSGLVTEKQHQTSGIVPNKTSPIIEHPISGVVTTNEMRPKKKRIKITKPRPRTINKNVNNNNKLRKYVPFMKHNDHDYPKIRGKVLMTDDEAEKYFKNFEPMEEDKDESDPLDISTIQNHVLNDPNVDMNIFGPEVVIKDEPMESPKKKKEQKEKDKIDYNDLSQQNFKCLKCQRTFTKHSFERHKCGTLKIDNISNITDINSTLNQVINQQNWQNRKIVFTCSVCQKLCNNVNELADHLNAVHSQKPSQTNDPLSLENETESKKDVKVMVCNVLTPIEKPPVNPKAVIKINSNSNKLVPIAPRIENSNSPAPLFVQNDHGKSFFLVPENSTKLDVLNALPPMPTLTPIPKINNVPPVIHNYDVNQYLTFNGKPMKRVYLRNEEISMKFNNQLVNGKPKNSVVVNNINSPPKSANEPVIKSSEMNNWVMVNGKPMKAVYFSNGQLTEPKKNESKVEKPAMIQSTDFNQWIMLDGKVAKVVNASEKSNKLKGTESDTSGTVTASDDDEVKIIKQEPPDLDEELAKFHQFKPIILRNRLLK